VREIDLGNIRNEAKTLRAGDRVTLTGILHTARDAAHKRVCALLAAGEPLPFALGGAVVYYAGPTPTKPGHVIGSCGPTTSGRMDSYTPALLARGLAAMVGKGERSAAVCASIVEHAAPYFCAVGGAGALAARCVESCEEIAFADLGCESVKRLVVRQFPVILAIDIYGGNLFARQEK
jgi:fumarate hydratase subunit beta